MKIIINPDGQTGRQQNPYYCESLSTYTCYDLPDCPICKGCHMAKEFEHTHPSYPVIGGGKPGEVVNAELVWQTKPKYIKSWFFLNIDGIDDYKKLLPIHDYRQVYQPITPTPINTHDKDFGEIMYEEFKNMWLTKKANIDGLEEASEKEYPYHIDYRKPFITGANRQHAKTLEAVEKVILRYTDDFQISIEDLLTQIKTIKP